MNCDWISPPISFKTTTKTNQFPAAGHFSLNKAPWWQGSFKRILEMYRNKKGMCIRSAGLQLEGKAPMGGTQSEEGNIKLNKTPPTAGSEDSQRSCTTFYRNRVNLLGWPNWYKLGQRKVLITQNQVHRQHKPFRSTQLLHATEISHLQPFWALVREGSLAITGDSLSDFFIWRMVRAVLNN